MKFIFLSLKQLPKILIEQAHNHLHSKMFTTDLVTEAHQFATLFTLGKFMPDKSLNFTKELGS